MQLIWTPTPPRTQPLARVLTAAERVNMTTHHWRCGTCPFETSDEDAKRGHEQYLSTNPRGWLGHGEAHAMHPQAPWARAFHRDSGTRCEQAETTRDCPLNHIWRDREATTAELRAHNRAMGPTGVPAWDRDDAAR